MRKPMFCFVAFFLILYPTIGTFPVTMQAGFHQIAKFGTAMFRSIAWSPDGTVLAVMNFKTVALYTSNLKKIAELDDGLSADQAISEVAWSPDGKYLASVGQFLWIWNIATGQRRILLPFDSRNPTVSHIGWSPDGTRLLTDQGEVWDVQSGKVVATLKHDGIFASVTWSPDGTRLATSSDLVRIWDAKTYELQNNLSTDPQLNIGNLAWSADSKFLAGRSYPQEIIVWDVRSTNRIAALNAQSGDTHALAWSLDGKLLASGDNYIHLWDTTTWQQRTLDEQDLGPIDDLSFSRNSTLASLAQDEVSLWNTNTEQRFSILSDDDNVEGGPIAWSPDSKLIAVGAGTMIQLRDGLTGSLTKKIDTHQTIKLLAWGPKSSLIATTDGPTSIRIWNIDTEQLTQTLASQPVDTSFPFKGNMSWSPDGTRLAVLSLPKTKSASDNITIWDTNTWRSVATFQGNCFSWSPDSRAIAIGKGENAFIINSKTWTVLVNLGSATVNDGLFQPISSISWSPRGDNIAAEQFEPRGSLPHKGSDPIWDAKSGKILAQEELSSGFDWHPGGKLIARVVPTLDPGNVQPGYADVQIYNLDTKAVSILRGHSDDVVFVAWSPDGRRLISSSLDYTVRIWGS